jgi:hypothetical protein
VFVVFRKATKLEARKLPAVEKTSLATIGGPWNVSFQANRGAPSSITLEALNSWTQNSDSGVKYFSGVGTYTRIINASPDWFKTGARYWLDLGDVKELADVFVNGVAIGVSWHAPYRVDITRALRSGKNTLKIEVTDTWVNRLIGDQQPNASKVTFADVAPYKASSPLMPAGLIGPVQIVRESTR